MSYILADCGRADKHAFFSRSAYDIWRRTLRRRMPHIRNEGVEILDCGCGEGRLLSCLERWFPKAGLTGLDVSAEAIAGARSLTRNAKFVRHTAERLPFPDSSYDVIFALHVVEHLRRPKRFLSEARRVLGKGGLLMMATPNPSSLGARIMGAKWKSCSEEHVNLHPPRFWRSALSGAGFTIVRDGTTGISGLPPFGRFPIGLLSWIPQFLFGFFPYQSGESYIAISRVERKGQIR